MVSFKGFDEGFLTFRNIEVRKGDPVAIKLDGVAERANNNTEFVGFCTDVPADGYVTVQVKGYIEVPYTGTKPEPGYATLTSNGAGGVKLETGGRMIFKVLKVDTENHIIGFIL